MAGEGGYDQATELLVGGLTDVIDGNPDNLVRMQKEALAKSAEMQAAQSGGGSSSQTAQSSSASDYTFTCPETGKSHTIPISANSQSCRKAMERYARVAGCNMVDDLAEAEKGYYSACADQIYQ